MSSWKRMPSAGASVRSSHGAPRPRAGYTNSPESQSATRKRAWSMRPLRSSWARMIPASRPKCAAVASEAESVAVDAGAPAVADHELAAALRLRRHLPEVVLPAASAGRRPRGGASEPPAGPGAVGDAHAHALHLAAAVGPRAVDRELRVVGRGPVGGVLEVPVRVGHAGAQVGRAALLGQPGHDRGGARDAGAGPRGSTWLKGESSE